MWFEWKIDFEGQKRAELISQVGIILFAVIGFVVGFLLQNLLLTFQIFGGGIFITALIVLPPWSFYNQHPIQWLPSVQSDQDKHEPEESDELKEKST
ncbi:microsomal signal peptidase 12 kDa subunit-domain-containing protein [Glomus cerebriforme]|uniref:Signal peptidase complex subunit 1 n=1 Tax=Glomus cerebriforme TaxID=658196 RepID=A0A397SZK0_9GLOM|nr:microsomal signal peptidase 12 kDa subunit-domain-containing protein [Glomus cerebriforme]